MTDAGGVLAGLRVIEISSFVAAPLGGMTLAQLGADVIRVDPVCGAADQAPWPRTADGASLYWAGLNKGKRSVTIDFRSPHGQELIAGLITAPGPDRGILLTNAIGRRFLEHETLRRHRPDLIQVVISGYRDGSAAVDYTVNAALGFPWLTGPTELAAPVNHVLPAWDMACGLHAAIGILAAERRRRRIHGTGGLVNIALYDVALAMVANLGLLAEAEVNHVQRGRIGNSPEAARGRPGPGPCSASTLRTCWRRSWGCPARSSGNWGVSTLSGRRPDSAGHQFGYAIAIPAGWADWAGPEIPVERIYREVRLLRLYEGTSEIQRLIIGGALYRDQQRVVRPGSPA